MKQTIALLVVASAAAFAFIFGNEADEISLTDLAFLLGALGAILVLQAAFILVADRLLRLFGVGDDRVLIARLLAAAFAATNAFFTAFVTYDSPFEIQVALSLGWGAILYAVMNSERWQPFARFLLSAYFVMSLGLYGITRLQMASNAYAATNVPRVSPARNVYLIGQESLHSPKAFRELYGLDDPAHVDFLARRGFRILDRAYSADVQTLPTYSRMLEFGRRVEESEIRYRRVFQSENSTFEAFERSGFDIQFIYRNGYFSLDPDLVDFHHPNSGFFHCGPVPNAFFYGLCTRGVKREINRLLFGLSPQLDIELVERRLEEADRSNRPWLTIYHHAWPFHTEMNHRHEDQEAIQVFRTRMHQATREVLQRGMEEMVETIQEEDPDAVIVLFGDHGTGLTRGADLDAPEPPLTSAQILEDRYGVMVAVYPAGFCTNRIFEGSTTTALIENVIHCLNGDDSPTAAELAESRTFYWEGEPRDVARYIQLSGRAGMRQRR